MAKRSNKNGPSETVVFQGIRYRRYPEAERRDIRVYYQSGRGYLHRAIWAAAHGEIPKGYHVHHLDGDPLNNELHNLDAVPGRQHLSEHTRERRAIPELRAGLDAALEKARVAAAEWHGSDEGRAWHSEHGRDVAAKRRASLPWERRTCVVCSGTFQSQHGANVCSNKCFAKQRRDSGVDDIEFTCGWCGGKFMRNRYSKPVYCSRSCNTRRNNWLRYGGVQPSR